MCGITGYLQFNREGKTLETELKRSVSTLKRRGPDNQQTMFLPGVGLGHTRLSIINLATTANQPMVDPTGRYTIVFNGEIFNYKKLQVALGIKSTSDTEVLLHAYIRWKEKCLEKLHGFFAFAIYDREEHSLFLARDRFGIKPLYYAQTGEAIYFASELKALMAFPIQKELNPDAFHAFFQLTYVPSPFSIFKHVEKVQAGQFVTINQHKKIKDDYFTLEASGSYTSYEEAKNDLSQIVDQAVAEWMASDAPLGSFLSGGVDSSIVVALASQKVSNLKTFSVTFPDSPFHDESKYSDIVAKMYGTQHNVIPLTTQNILDYVDEVLDYMDEPFADSSAIPSFALCKKVSGQIKVALSGDGADEVFGGYEKYRGELLARKYGWLSPIGHIVHPMTAKFPQSRDSKFLNLIRKGNRFLEGIARHEEERYWGWSQYNSQEDLSRILGQPSSNWKKDFFPPYFSQTKGINKVLIKDMRLVLEGDMLTKVDRISMANSLEVRPVLLDHAIVQAALKMPEHFKITQNLKKKILIDTFKHLLPEEVYNRPKHGFSIELLPFFRTKYWEKINDVFLNDQLTKKQNIFDPQGIIQLKKSIKQGQNKDIQSLVWSLISFQNFWIKFMESVK